MTVITPNRMSLALAPEPDNALDVAMALPSETARLLKEWRLSQRPPLSQENAARLLGVRPRTFIRWERGHNYPQRSNVEHLAKRMKLDPEEFYPEVENPTELRDQLDRMEALLLEIREALTADVAPGRDLRDLGREPADREQSQQAPGRTRTRRQGR